MPDSAKTEPQVSLKKSRQRHLLSTYVYYVLYLLSGPRQATLGLALAPGSFPGDVKAEDGGIEDVEDVVTQELLEEGCGYPQCRLLFAAENNGQNRSLYI